MEVETFPDEEKKGIVEEKKKKLRNIKTGLTNWKIAMFMEINTK